MLKLFLGNDEPKSRILAWKQEFSTSAEARILDFGSSLPRNKGDGNSNQPGTWLIRIAG